jgi:hypothetical protein
LEGMAQMSACYKFLVTLLISSLIYTYIERAVLLRTDLPPNHSGLGAYHSLARSCIIKGLFADDHGLSWIIVDY